MPRIDPERLLKCLAPLLNPSTGAIRSAEEVDKIFGLMSKFSKKLVSKCIYVNILRATAEDVVDRFMERGGWNLVFGWTNDAIVNKNYKFLQEIFSLLLRTPVTVARLKSNRFPVVVKDFSKNCEDEPTKNVCKSLVTKWIAVARGEEASKTDLQQQQQLQVQPQVVQMQNSIGGDLPNLGNMNDHLLNIDTGAMSMLPDTDGGNPGLMDIEISNNDFAGIDLNLDILDNMEQPLEDSLAAMGGDVSMHQPTAAPISVIQHAPPQNQYNHQIMTGQQPMQTIYDPHPNHPQIIDHQQQQQHSIQMLPSGIPTTSNVVLTNVNTISHTNSGLGQQHIQIIQTQQPQPQPTVSFVQPQTNLIIKSVDGHHAVVQNNPTVSANFCLMVKDGKNYLVRLKEPIVSAPSSQMVVQQPQPIPQQIEETPKVPPLVIKVDQTDSKKLKSPKKEPLAVSPVNKVPGDMKTYSKTKAGSSSSSPSSSSGSLKDKSKDHKSSSSSKSKSSESSHRHRKSKQESAANKAAEAAQQAKEDERLREKIRREKAQMKKRQKEVIKQKEQTEKDNETLKKLNLVPSSSQPSSSSTANVTSSPNSVKIPRIPKRNSSFADAIGIPGSDGGSSADKIKKVSPDKMKEKEKGKEKEDGTGTISGKKFYGKKEEDEEKSDDKPKERRHKPKVFVSSRSRNDDLLDEMTDPKKGKDSKDKGKEKDKEEVKPTVAGSGNCIVATPPKHMTKRLSTDALEKPDAKKAKLDGGKDKKETAKEPSVKDKIRAITLQESSLFMSALAGATGPKSTKKKRRTSSGDSKDSAPTKSEDAMQVDEPVAQDVKKPTMGFYCETLNDEDDKRDNEKEDESKDDENMEDEQGGSFTPQENDGKVKSALVLVRSRNRPRKTVRWRDDDELKEFHYFEMDETERVNVTKQKDFTALSANERKMEGSMLKNIQGEEEEERNRPWKLRKIVFTKDILDPPIISTEVTAQDEREKTVLGLFLPPGAPLPESGDEPDPAAVQDKSEPRMIPVEDVISITKVCDYRTHSWPDPKGMGNFGMNRSVGFGVQPPSFPRNQSEPQGMRQGFGQFNPTQNQFPPQMVPHPQQSPTNVTPVPDFNPWNASLGFSVPPPLVGPETGGFGQFGGTPAAPLGMGILGAPGIPPVIPPPTYATGNPFAFPPPAAAVMGQMNGTHGANPLMEFGQSGRSGNQRGGSRFDGADRRNNFGRDRDRDRSGSRDRDYRDDRSSRDRDHRRGNDRDYRNNHDRDRNSDRNNRDFRRDGSRNIRKEIPCRFFKKGHCSNGSRCEFLHEGSSDASRRRSPTQSGNEDDWESSPSTHMPDSAQSPPPEDRTVNPNHQPRTTSRFSDAPMSPTEESPSSPVGMFQGGGDTTKVIPA